MAHWSRPLGFRVLFFLAAIVLLGTGCTGVRVAPSDVVVHSADGLELLSDGGRGSLYIRRPSPRLAGFTKVRLTSVYISYKKRIDRRRPAEEGALAHHFRDALMREFEDSFGWTLVEEPGSDVLNLQLGALDMDLADEPIGNETATVFVAPGGTVNLVLDLRFSTDDEPLFRYVQQRRLPGGVYYDASGLEFERVKRSIDSFVVDSRERVQRFYRAGNDEHAAR